MHVDLSRYMYSCLLSLTISLLHFDFSDALSCGNCKNVTDAGRCNVFSTCRDTERCYTTAYGTGDEAVFDLGCMSETDCFSTSAISVVGKRSDGQVHCSQCCAVNWCNKQLCSAGIQITNNTSNCSDDPEYDCQQISSQFNICGDVHHAKTVCRKWCGLCDLVDGIWSTWSAWGQCDVTCGTGKTVRTRSCSNPSPAHGGLPCSGNNTQTSVCTLKQCPVHGGWSTWNVWGACSHTCGMGTKSRNRTCDNPTPALAGNHCFGDASEYQACFIRGCIDGGWSSWTSWSNCTGGLQSKHRMCNNPAPSTFGKGCIGQNTDTKRCGPVAFTVYHKNGGYVNGTFIFDHVISNIGGGYDVTSGRFTCAIPGVYVFTFSAEVRGDNYAYCYVRKNGANVTFVRVKGEDGKYISESNSVYLPLSSGDIVDVGNCDGQAFFWPDFSTNFSGALI